MVFRKNVMRVSVLPILIGVFSQWTLSSFDSKETANNSISIFESELHIYPALESRMITEKKEFSVFLEKDIQGFKEALAFKESQGRYTIVNTFGYLGKYQFGKGTLELVGIYNPNKFLKNPALQERAFLANLSRNKWILRKDIKRSVGKYINGIVVTESGILAAAHLAGPGAVKKFLRSRGELAFSDGYGTTIEQYMKKFSAYDVSAIVGNRKAKA